MASEYVSDNDIDLVALYRFIELPASVSGMVFNRSRSTIYGAYNNLSISGGLAGLEVVLPTEPARTQAPLSSGARASGASSEILHLPFSPAQSGNASGIDASSTQDISFGGWFLFGYDDNPSASTGDFIGKFSNGASQRGYVISASSGVVPPAPEWKWRAGIGTSNGGGSTSVLSPFQLTSGKYEHVVCTINAQTSTNNVILYVSGIAVATGSIIFSPGTSGATPAFRLFSSQASTSESVANGVGGRGAEIAEAFLIRRNLSPEEVSGIYLYGFTDGLPQVSGIIQSDINDSQKDNLGNLGSLSNIIFTAWKNTELANPSGIRHATSGFHPAFIQILGQGVSSGLNFGSLLQGTASGVKVITFRNSTPNTRISGMKFWMDDYGILPLSGWNVSYHANSKWLPNLTLPSGSGLIGRSYTAASSVLRSDGGLTISGYSLNGTVQSGEQEISQYIYLGFTTDSEFTPPGTYGPNKFTFRISAYNV